MNYLRIFSVLAFSAMSSPIYAMPAQVLLLRHAEKPADRSIHLSDRGWERARALPTLFHERSEFQRFGLPVALFAMATSKESIDPGVLGGSVRAIETLQFVSKDLGLPVNTQYTRDNYDPMVEAIFHSPEFDGKLVVICWEHKALTGLAQSLGVDPAPEYPGEKFDRAWLVSFGQGTATLVDLPEHLLPGDD